jgi:hypothetical protein
MGHADSSSDDLENETWLVDAGHLLIEKKRAKGPEALTPRERLIQCFWVADYSMRNAGDLATARDLDARFREDALAAAMLLDLPFAVSTFELSDGELERRYFDFFGPLCAELRGR